MLLISLIKNVCFFGEKKRFTLIEEKKKGEQDFSLAFDILFFKELFISYVE